MSRRCTLVICLCNACYDTIVFHIDGIFPLVMRITKCISNEIKKPLEIECLKRVVNNC